MKRVLSFALSLVMLLSITGGLGLTAYAGDTYYETEDNDDYSLSLIHISEPIMCR